MSTSNDNHGQHTPGIKPEDVGKVAVLMGGLSKEREISLLSGGAVLDALNASGVDAHGIDVGADVMTQLEQGDYDRAFIILHGRGGEDGEIQRQLEAIDLPYTGSGVTGSAQTMDKLKTKQLWQALNLPTPAYAVLNSEDDCVKALETPGLPLIIKPVNEGSSLGMSKVNSAEELPEAWRMASTFDDTVIAERWIDGAEYTAAILGRDVLPLIRLETPLEFYDYEAKYSADSTRYRCPCGLDTVVEAELQALALKAFDCTGASGWGRVDFMLDEEQNPWLIEVNTVPGMTDHSLVPMAAKAAGLSFEDLVLRILQSSFEQKLNKESA